MYRTNALAAAALGVNVAAFAEVCQRYGLETPYMRRKP
jgi:hypothetical protein